MSVDRKIRILTIDDDANICSVIKRFLQPIGKYNVLTAKSGEIGLLLTSYHWRKPHLILLDIKMQGIDGYEVLRRIRSNRKTTYIPVIMITGLSDTAAKIKAEGLYCVPILLTRFFSDSDLKQRI